ncbi:centrosomal AT-AC splicing factor [Anolis sagrei]|uniref:centrosomal AT-AC splicing factor n=1 Tax=Anolis sagrei TaxID=38937 RepID=UPI003521A3AD
MAEGTVFWCGLCRRSAFVGRRRHTFSAGHQRRLRGTLARLAHKVDAARKMLKHAEVVPFDPAEHERQFWCACCGQEVRLHLSHGSLAVLHGGLLEHLASPGHKRGVSAFWWENKADPKLKAKFLVSPEEYERFKASLTKALDAYEEKEDEGIKEAAARIREAEQRRQEMLQALLEPQRETEPCDGAAAAGNGLTTRLSDSAFATDEQGQPQPSSSTTMRHGGRPGFLHRSDPEPDWLESRQPLTFIGHQDTASGGNIHTGAKPPWMMEEEEEEEEGASQGQIGPSYEEFLKEKEKQKLKKLPPNRVGANFDHTSETGEGWLPSFGRVWNHGRRWQSRHQFKAEAGDKPRSKRKEPKTE